MTTTKKTTTKKPDAPKPLEKPARRPKGAGEIVGWDGNNQPIRSEG